MTNNTTSTFELFTGDTNIQDWVQINRQAVVEKLKQHGAILFRGFLGGLENFLAFTDLFCDSYMFNPIATKGARRDVSIEHKVQTVDASGVYFQLHAERAQTPFRPDLAFFHCIRAPRSGGETTFCDGTLLISKMPLELRAALLEKSFRYVTLFQVEQMLRFLDIEDPDLLQQTLASRSLEKIFSIQDGRVVMDYMTPILTESKFSKNLAFANFLLFARFILKRRDFPIFADGSEIPQSLCMEIDQLAQRITTPVHWQDGDFLMLDNTRVMHGRNAVSPNIERIIWSRFGYVGSH
jgi:hypothetical protein